MGSSFRRPYTVTRKTKGTVVLGKFSDNGATSTFTIQASVQALNPDEMRALPEGRRDTQTAHLFTDTKLNIATADVNPDLVQIGSDQYEVVMEWPWQNGVINHYKYQVMKSAL